MAETWVLNETLANTIPGLPVSINFSSNNLQFIGFDISQQSLGWGIAYTPQSGYGIAVFDSEIGWEDQAYRTVTFERDTKGDLLTWLEANGTLYLDTTVYDLTQLSLDPGTHEITVKAKTATSESDFSEAKEYIVE